MRLVTSWGPLIQLSLDPRGDLSGLVLLSLATKTLDLHSLTQRVVLRIGFSDI